MGIFSKNKSAYSDTIGWNEIESLEQLEEAFGNTKETPALFFKHSTRCSISRMALSRFEKNWTETDQCKLYYIDLLAHRDVSNRLSELSEVVHQSPQAILVKDKATIYNNSHNGISAEEIQKLI